MAAPAHVGPADVAPSGLAQESLAQTYVAPAPLVAVQSPSHSEMAVRTFLEGSYLAVGFDELWQ